MELVLKGKTALITGAARRVGREISVALAEAGADIVVHYNSSHAEAEKLRSNLEDYGVSAWTVRADFEKPEEYNTLIKRSIEKSGRLDILINSASIFPENTLSDMQFTDVMSNAHVNAWVPFALGRSFALESGKGDIVNLLDTRIAGFDMNHTAYILSKHMLSTLSDMMALEFAPGIRVNAVAPGLILPPPGKDEAFLEKAKDLLPLKRHGSPGDVAGAVLFLLGNEFITGQTIFVDGGRHLRERSGG